MSLLFGLWALLLLLLFAGFAVLTALLFGPGGAMRSRSFDFRLDRCSVEVSLRPIGPVRVGNDVVWMRPPRLADGPAWRAACLRDETVSLTAWAERVLDRRAGVRAGLMVAWVMVDGHGRVVGEISFTIDPRTGAGEASLWMGSETSPGVRAWAFGSAVLRMFSLPTAVDRLVAPVAVGNPGPIGLFASLGFTRQATARNLRRYGETEADHDIWWLDRGDDLLAKFGEVLESSSRRRHVHDVDNPPARRTASRAEMTLPVARALWRRRSSWRRCGRERHERTVGSHKVELPLGEPGPVLVNGTRVGSIDARYDAGSSTIEIRSRIEDRTNAALVVDALVGIAHARAVRRLAWAVKPLSATHAAVADAGFQREGSASGRAGRHDEIFEQWAMTIDDEAS